MWWQQACRVTLLVHRALQHQLQQELPSPEAVAEVAPAQDEEFVISHSDNVQATGFVEHLKLPHYVDFQSELNLVRRMRAEVAARDETHQEAAE